MQVGERRVCNNPLLSLPSPITEAAQEGACLVHLQEGAEQKPPRRERSLEGSRDQGPWAASGAVCSPLSRGATLNAAMPLPLACCQDGEVLTRPQDSSAPQLVVGILRATRIPGLHYMCTRPQSRLRRLLWSLAFLASAGLLATGTADRLHHLLSRPVHTRARLAWAPQLRFPAVTLCNPNRARFLHLTKPDLYSVGEWLGLARENHSLVPEMLAVLGEDQRAWLTRLANYSRFLPPRRSERTMQSFFHRLGHQIEDMLVECRFQGERCGPQHFTPVSSLLEGAGQLGCPMRTGNDASPPLQQGWRSGTVRSQAEMSLSKGHERLYLPSITSMESKRSFWTSSFLQNT
ncbi:acid-sensing ion channel 2-like [Agelaius tricolor]|uniref:acid-sensing ion channel 2-like n=1 Tax=Agelaius tricolor TaxID=9191 RepID=UPI0039F1C3A4